MIKRTILSVVVIIAAIVTLWEYLWENENTLTPSLIAAACVLVAAHIILYFLKCRSWVVISFLVILNGIVLCFSLYVIAFLPAFIVVIIGVIVHSTSYMYQTVKGEWKWKWDEIGKWVGTQTWIGTRIGMWIVKRIMSLRGKENKILSILRVILLWVVSIVVFWVIVTGLIIYRMSVSEAERARTHQQTASQSSIYADTW